MPGSATRAAVGRSSLMMILRSGLLVGAGILVASEALRPTSCGVNDCQDADLFLDNTIGGNVRRVGDYQLARTVHPSGAAEIGMLPEQLDPTQDCVPSPCRRFRIVFGDELAD